MFMRGCSKYSVSFYLGIRTDFLKVVRLFPVPVPALE